MASLEIDSKAEKFSKCNCVLPERGSFGSNPHGGGFNPLAAPDGHTIYYLRGEKEAWLWAVGVEGGSETPAIEGDTGQTKWIDLTNWVVVRRGIYFLEGKPVKQYTL